MAELQKWCSENPALCALLVVLVIILLWNVLKCERFVNRSVNFFGARHPDHPLYKYNNRNRDPAGMDMNDYFLENQMTHQYGAGSELHGTAAFDSRVHAEDTELKASDEPAPIENPASDAGEHFVGGLAY